MAKTTGEKDNRTHDNGKDQSSKYWDEMSGGFKSPRKTKRNIIVGIVMGLLVAGGLATGIFFAVTIYWEKGAENVNSTISYPPMSKKQAQNDQNDDCVESPRGFGTASRMPKRPGCTTPKAGARARPPGRAMPGAGGMKPSGGRGKFGNMLITVTRPPPLPARRPGTQATSSATTSSISNATSGSP